MAFFPNYLRLRYSYEQQAKTRKPFPEDQMPKMIDIVKHYVNTDEIHIFLCTSDPNPLDEIACEASYKFCVKPELHEISKWITKKSYTSVITENLFSIEVYIRIVTSMLNKLVENGIISKELGMHYHDNLVANLRALYFEVSSEDLPF